jgi:cathepsin B
MNKLTAELQTKIKANPTNTILKSDDENLEKLYTTDVCKIKTKQINNLPSNFDGRIIWKDYLTPVYNQKSCGACWAVASTSVLADKFNIQSAGQQYIELSISKLILCSKNFENSNYVKNLENQIYLNTNINNNLLKENIKTLSTFACYGNTLYNAFQYLYLFGTCTKECIPYNLSLGIENQYDSISNFTSSEKLPLCEYVSGPLEDMCSDFFVFSLTGVQGGTPSRFYRAHGVYGIPGTEKYGGSEKDIRNELYVWGPVASAFKVYPDFYTFDAKNEIYEWNGEGEQVGGHAIEIVGWGIDNDKPYWIIENSWGEEWGDKGFFKMIRGKNNCEIEENVISAVPDFFYKHNTKIPEELRIFSNNDLKKFRDDINTNKNNNIVAGGIEPTTGYTRRVMNTFNNIDFKSPYDLKKMADRNNFVAGEMNNNKLKVHDNKTNSNKKKYNHIIMWIFVLIILILILYYVYS